MQKEAPVVPLNVPAEQDAQAEEPDEATKVPGLQAVHKASSILVAPVCPYDPEPHCCPVHAKVPDNVLYVPEAHIEQVDEPEALEKYPDSQGEHVASFWRAIPAGPKAPFGHCIPEHEVLPVVPE